jgi:hypothetical protein
MNQEPLTDPATLSDASHLDSLEPGSVVLDVDGCAWQSTLHSGSLGVREFDIRWLSHRGWCNSFELLLMSPAVTLIHQPAVISEAAPKEPSDPWATVPALVIARLKELGSGPKAREDDGLWFLTRHRFDLIIDEFSDVVRPEAATSDRSIARVVVEQLKDESGWPEPADRHLFPDATADSDVYRVWLSTFNLVAARCAEQASV